MRRIKSMTIFIMFAATWLLLLWFTGSHTPWQIFSAADPLAGITVSLGDVPVQNYDRMGFTGGQVKYIRKDHGWLVGTDRGELFHFDRQGAQLWKHSMGDGTILSMAVSGDEKIVYIGERSPMGMLYAIDVKSGNILWQFSGETVVGADPSIRSNPAPVHLSADAEGRVYANFFRFTLNEKGKRGYIGRVIAFDPKGEELWRFPKEKNLDSWISWGDVNTASSRYVFSTANYDSLPDMQYNKLLYVLDRKTGSLIHSTDIPPEEWFNTTVMRGSPNFSADGKHLAGIASDGRAFLFDEDGTILWMRRVSQSARAGGAWINAAGRDGYVLPEGAVFTTINTFNRENWQLPTPVIHPGSNGLFLFALDGTFRFRYTARGEIEAVAFAPGLAAVAVGRNVRNHDYSVHGAAAISLADGKELDFFHAEGPVQAISVSDDGRYIAGIEAPAVTPDGRLIGAYRFHIWDTQKETE